MDERTSQYFLAVGRMCGDAGLGRLTVRLTLADGRVVTGVPDPLRETEGAAELDAIGYADAVTVGGIEVALSAVVEASVTRPGLDTSDEAPARRIDPQGRYNPTSAEGIHGVP
jgi:hypothetical protein